MSCALIQELSIQELFNWQQGAAPPKSRAKRNGRHAPGARPAAELRLNAGDIKKRAPEGARFSISPCAGKVRARRKRAACTGVAIRSFDFFPVQGQVETFTLLIRANAQTDHQVDHLEDDEAHDAAV
jgi:hypothetical protein